MIAENWVDLPTLPDVARAMVCGWDIKVRVAPDVEWEVWEGTNWKSRWQFQGRPRQPKMKKVSVVGWYDGEQVFRLREGVEPKWPSIRVYSEDGVIEVPDNE